MATTRDWFGFGPGMETAAIRRVMWQKTGSDAMRKPAVLVARGLQGDRNRTTSFIPFVRFQWVNGSHCQECQ